MDNSFEKLINRVLDTRYKIENVVGIGGMAYESRIHHQGRLRRALRS